MNPELIIPTGPTIAQFRAIDRENARLVSESIHDEFRRIYYHALNLSGREN